MREEDIRTMLAEQKTYFREGKTLSVQFRIKMLKKLKKNIKNREDEICRALYKDLGKSHSESYMTEIGMAYEELNYMIRHTEKFAARKRIHTPLAQTAATSYVLPVPKGTVLIMSPWNYPFFLVMDPLIDAVAAGNVVMVKPSAYAPHTEKVVKKIIFETFPREMVTVITGGREENKALLQQKFNHIFFTGSQAVGKEVLKKAAEHFTPVTLELGGKSPCIIEKTADVRLAARRIVFGKFMNSGQTCVAPDYVCCDESIVEEFKEAVIREIQRQFGKKPLKNHDYGKIINEKHFTRLTKLLKVEKICYGGKTDEEGLKIEPTIIYPCTRKDKIMEEEIFGPLLPILGYSSLKDTLDEINDSSHPLAFYVFTEDQKVKEYVTKHCPSGGCCINDTIIHLATSHMGFGGFMESGMGSYHGKKGFDTFTHYKSVVDKKTWMDFPVRYAPYSHLKDRVVKLFLK